MNTLFLIFLVVTTAVTPLNAGFWNSFWDSAKTAVGTTLKVMHAGYKKLGNAADNIVVDTNNKFIQIKGTLVCKGKPYAEGSVEVWKQSMVWDYHFSTVNTDKNGNWKSHNNYKPDLLWNKNAAYIKVLHRCGVIGIKKCFNHFIKPIPQEAITHHKEEIFVYDMGTMELSTDRPNFENKCK